MVGSVPLAEVNAGTFDVLVAGLRARGFAPVVVKNVWAVMKKALRQAWRWEKLPADPSARAKAPYVPKKEAAYVTVEKVQEISTRFDELGAVDLAVFFRTLFQTGARPGELLALRWGDVDLERGTVRIERVVSETAADCFVVEATKTEKSTAGVDLPGVTVAQLRRLRAHYLEAKEVRGLAWNPSGWLWPGRDATMPRRPSSVAKSIEPISRMLGLTRRTPTAQARQRDVAAQAGRGHRGRISSRTSPGTRRRSTLSGPQHT